MNKDLIKVRFSKHLEDYNNNASVQRLMAENLLKYCSFNSYESILEIGCGTGFLTELIDKKIAYTKYTAIDLVEECGKYIEDINSKIDFISADVETFDFDSYDLIISNAALQWSENFISVTDKLKHALKPGGELIFSTFGREHFREIFYIMGTTLEYYSEEDLKLLIRSQDNDILTGSEIYIKSFDKPKDVLQHLKLTGVNSLERKIWTKKDLETFENAYFNLCGARPTLTYNPIYVKFQNKTLG